MDDPFCFRHWAGWLVMHCLLGFRARGWFPCHRQATKDIFFKITINLQFLSICGGLFLVSTMVLTFFKRENKRSQIATEEPPGLVATYKYTTAFIWIIFIERIYGNPEPKTKLNDIPEQIWLFPELSGTSSATHLCSQPSCSSWSTRFPRHPHYSHDLQGFLFLRSDFQPEKSSPLWNWLRLVLEKFL